MKQNENTKYIKLGITGASVLAFGFAIMYILNQSQNIVAGIRGIFNILKPFLYGALIAYILAPMCNRMDDRFLKWFPNATEKQKKSLKFLSIAIAVISAVTIVILLLLLLVTVAEITLPPNCDNVSLTLLVVLCTIDTRTVTLITPIMIPSMVKNDLNFVEHIEANAILIACVIFIFCLTS